MKCPKCAAAMAKVEFQGVEVDRCTECLGMWFDLLEHEQLKTLSGSEVIDIGAPEVGKINNTITRIACPSCTVPLISMVVAGQPHISYEACTVCYGVYFDAGEFKDYKEETFGEIMRALFGRAKPQAPA